MIFSMCKGVELIPKIDIPMHSCSGFCDDRRLCNSVSACSICFVGAVFLGFFMLIMAAPCSFRFSFCKFFLACSRERRLCFAM